MQQGLLVEFSCNSPIRYLIAYWRALLVVKLFVLEWRVVATTNTHINGWFELQAPQLTRVDKVIADNEKL